ncbi:hypothetical protein J6590_009151 [Homalodisca vitripennis]|nr:hypothetical protein J6590_009151 [Homalodisca vitripennis]
MGTGTDTAVAGILFGFYDYVTAMTLRQSCPSISASPLHAPTACTGAKLALWRFVCGTIDEEHFLTCHLHEYETENFENWHVK